MVDRLPGARHDSVIARPGIPNGHPDWQVHWEFVVPDVQAYSDFLWSPHLGCVRAPPVAAGQSWLGLETPREFPKKNLPKELQEAGTHCRRKLF